MKAATVNAFGNEYGLYISIHAAREGGDVIGFVFLATAFPFQSTPPVKAATPTAGTKASGQHISIHAAREGGDRWNILLWVGLGISIHAAREGGDPTTNRAAAVKRKFQSTPPVKAATGYVSRKRLGIIISIHAAREGGDSSFVAESNNDKAFQSTPPVKAATNPLKLLTIKRVFQSTPPVKAATNTRHCNFRYTVISIHAAREGGDVCGYDILGARYNFNPRRP